MTSSEVRPGEAPVAAGERRTKMEWVRQAGVVSGCVGLFIVFSVLTPDFRTGSNLLEIMLQSSINAIIAIGMTLVVMAKGIDLSVGSVVGLSSMVAASQMSLGIGVAAASGVAVGLVCGFLNGLIIAKLRLPDFIVTLGTM